MTTTDPKPSTNRSTGGQGALRGGAAFLMVVLLLGGLFLLVDFTQERPDYYQPARAPITEASMILSETYSEAKELVQRLQRLHNRLDNTLALLGQAERLDPADERKIVAMQGRLRALEDTDRMLATDPEALQRAYHDLTEQLNGLARKLAQPLS
jgi:uncharacterized protein HemX